jgi:creatinine amidohydrolase/Fe(II)-dependent formamide hydrolase-like protein
MRTKLAALVCFLAGWYAVGASAQVSSPADRATSPDPNTPRPIDAHDSVFLEELTWMEVRDALRAGKTTVIVATGGIEQNGPYLALGKHNYVLRATTEAIARKLGTALVAPIVPFVPEGDVEPPSGHMRYPGTISVTEETYQRLLKEIASSLKAHGFRNIILLGDSGGNQTGMKAVAAELTAQWGRGPTRIHFISEYYDNARLEKWLATQGIRQIPEGIHDDYRITSVMMTVDPNTVRMKQRVARGKFSINGVNLSPAEQTIAMGKRLVDYHAGYTAELIQKAIGR